MSGKQKKNKKNSQPSHPPSSSASSSAHGDAAAANYDAIRASLFGHHATPSSASSSTVKKDTVIPVSVVLDSDDDGEIPDARDDDPVTYHSKHHSHQTAAGLTSQLEDEDPYDDSQLAQTTAPSQSNATHIPSHTYNPSKPNSNSSITTSSQSKPNGSNTNSRSDIDSTFFKVLTEIETRLSAISKILLDSTKLLRSLKNMSKTESKYSPLAEAIHSTLEDGAIKLEEIKLFHRRFGLLEFPKESFTKEEQEKYRVLRLRVSSDVRQISTRLSQLQAVARVRAPLTHTTNYDLHMTQQSASLDDNNEEGDSLLAGSSYQQEYDIENLDSHIEILEEEARIRNQFMQQIEKDVGQVHQMFLDMRGMVQEQQIWIDHIDESVTQANQKNKQAYEELLKAEAHQKAKRKNMCCLALLISIGLLVLAFLLYVVLS